MDYLGVNLAWLDENCESSSQIENCFVFAAAFQVQRALLGLELWENIMQELRDENPEIDFKDGKELRNKAAPKVKKAVIKMFNCIIQNSSNFRKI